MNKEIKVTDFAKKYGVSAKEIIRELNSQGVDTPDAEKSVIPEDMVAMVKAALSGDFRTAGKMHRKYYPLFRDLFIESNPIPVKAALAELGMIAPEYRLPLCEMAPANLQKLVATLKRCGVIG